MACLFQRAVFPFSLKQTEASFMPKGRFYHNDSTERDMWLVVSMSRRLESIDNHDTFTWPDGVPFDKGIASGQICLTVYSPTNYSNVQRCECYELRSLLIRANLFSR